MDTVSKQSKYRQFYDDLKSIVIFFNNPSLTKIDKAIQKEIAKVDKQSRNTWLESIPQSVLKDFSDQHEGDHTNIDYTVPFLHLSDNGWAQAIISKNLSLMEINWFKLNNEEKLNELSTAIGVVLKYDGKNGLNAQQQNEYDSAEVLVEGNFSFIANIKEKIEKWDHVRPEISATFQDLQRDYRFYEKYFDAQKRPELIVEYIEQQATNMPLQLKDNSLDKCEGQIKAIWKQLKEATVKNELARLNFNDLQPYSERDLTSLKSQFETIKQYHEESFGNLTNKYHLTTEEISDIESAIDELTADVRKRAYPRLESKSLTHQELDLLRWVKYYREYPEQRQQQITTIDNEFADIKKLIEQFEEIAACRYDANLLPGQSFDQWISLEKQIYSSYAQVLGNLHALAPAPTLEEDDYEVQLDFEKNGAADFAIIDDITQEGMQANNFAGIPGYAIDKIQQKLLDTTGLKFILRAYQTFAAKYILTYKHVLLGDEMGLGKTMEAIAVANHLYKHEGMKRIIIVSPFSVLINWNREVADKSDLPHYIFHGNDRRSALTKWKKTGGLLLTNYEQVAYINQYMPRTKVDFLVVDEAHNIKNPNAKRTQEAANLAERSNYKLFMTGTPLENRVDEMTALIGLLNHDVAADLKKYYEIAPEQYKHTIATVYLRRKRDDVLHELPDKNILVEWSQFTEEQQEAYERAVEAGNLMMMRRVAFLGEKSQKIDQIKDICAEAKANNDKVIVFSFFINGVIDRLQKELPNTADEPITGRISAKRRQKIIDKFSNSPDQNVLISEILAGGTGLNIQAANIVILCEPQFKPSTEEQAISRSYRMGQTKKVTIYRLLTEDSIDEVMEQILAEKIDSFNKFADRSTADDLYKLYKANNEKALKSKLLQVETDRLRSKHKVVSQDD